MRAKWAANDGGDVIAGGRPAGQPPTFWPGSMLPLMTALSASRGRRDLRHRRWRIVIAVAEGRLERAVIAYYGRVLPQFGWRPTAGESGRFDREERRRSIFRPPTGA